MLLLSLDLCSASGTDLLAKIRTLTSPTLAAIAQRFVRSFTIESPIAPGFRCVGAEVALDTKIQSEADSARISVTGNGETLESALTSCLGEAADLLSQFERDEDVGFVGAPQDFSNAVVRGWVAGALPQGECNLDWMRANDIVTGKTFLLPADLCVRRGPNRRAIEPVGALSSGVAAGSDFESAAVRAILELCERDAAALWWLGGRRPRRFFLEHIGYDTACALIARLRGGATERRTSILDISTDLGVPVVAAVSIGVDGRGLACGLAARLDWSDAMKAAILEMCQMELSAPVAEAKRNEAGEEALNAIDRRHLRRAAFEASNCELLRPHEFVRHSKGIPGKTLNDLRGRLGKSGIELLLINLTRADIGVPVVRAVSPDLQPFATTVTTARLAQAQSEASGAHSATAEVPLM